MAVFKYLILLCAFLECRAQAPDGWKKIKGKETVERDGQVLMLLGIWEKSDDGTRVQVMESPTQNGENWAAMAEKMVTTVFEGEVPIGSFEILPKPELGLRYHCQVQQRGALSSLEIYGLMRTDKLVFLEVESKAPLKLNLKEWYLGEAVKDIDGQARASVEKMVDRLNEAIEQFGNTKRELPEIVSVPSQGANNKQLLRVGVNREGEFVMLGVQFSEEQLAVVLRLFHRCQPDAPMQIVPHPEAPQKKIIELLNLAAAEKIARVNFAEITIDENTLSPIKKHDPNKLSKVTIEIKIEDDGTYSMGGVIQSEEMLSGVFSKHVEKADNPLLKISGSEKVVFKYCRKLIRLAAKSGIDEVIFGSYQKEKE